VNFMLKAQNAILYECGFSCDNVIFLKFGDEAFFVTDGRYETEAKEQIRDAEVVVANRRNMYPKVASLIKDAKVKKIVYDPKEWSVYDFENLAKEVEKVEFKKELDFSHKRRIIKSETEIELLKEAAKFGAKAFDNFATFLKTEGCGLSERRLHYEAQNILKNYGEFELSFSPIVAVSQNAAKCHALPLDRVLRDEDLILFDAGIKYGGYCSDRTRTSSFNSEINFKKDQSFSSKKIQKAYDTVLKAQERGIKEARSGKKANEIDRICREVIEKEGFGDLFIHSTGHGVGLDIHELPIISKESETTLQEGMVFTIEPGIYMPGEFGIRIEDTVVITSDGCEVIGR